MNPLLFSASLFILAVTINSSSVFLQKKYHIYSRFGNGAVHVHSLVILPAWVGFVWSTTNLTTSNGSLGYNGPL